MNKWLVVAVLITAAATGASVFALRDPAALAGSVARPCATHPCGFSPPRPDFCSTDFCGHGGPAPKAGWCPDEYCGHGVRAGSP